MCSVLRCGSSRRGAQRFKLPEDPEKRLEWVQFVFEVNGQRLKESSWTDITICREHFTDDCFGKTKSGSVQLRSSAVPSLRGTSEPGDRVENPRSVEPVETTKVSSSSEKSKHTSTDVVTTGCGPQEQKVLNKDKAAAVQMKKYDVSETHLVQLLHHKCLSCCCKLDMEKVTCGVVIALKQQRRWCEYRNQWKGHVNARLPADGLKG